MALLNDVVMAQGDPPLGFLNPLIYQYGTTAFNDITTGNNPGCGTDGFYAALNWDPITGPLEHMHPHTHTLTHTHQLRVLRARCVSRPLTTDVLVAAVVVVPFIAGWGTPNWPMWVDLVSGQLRGQSEPLSQHPS